MFNNPLITHRYTAYQGVPSPGIDYIIYGSLIFMLQRFHKEPWLIIIIFKIYESITIFVLLLKILMSILELFTKLHPDFNPKLKFAYF